jgi:hypothetical protein
VPFENPEESPNAITINGEKGWGGLLVNTENWFYYENLFIRATTESERYPSYLAVKIKVCGNETMFAKTNEVEEIEVT